MGAGTERSVIPAIGIDLGTTYSCVGYWKNDRVEIIPNEQGNRTTPSYVAFTDKERLIGEAALSQVALNPVNTIYDAKRLIGRKYSDKSVQSDMKLWPFQVVSGPKDRPMISVIYMSEKKEFAPEEISSMVLMKMKEISEVYIGSEVKDAVVTVPAYFNQAQRQATMDAGEIAGLNVLRTINEPTAAAIAYGLENSVSFTEERSVLVFDLGGGTCDVSVLKIENGNFKVKATAGDTHLGGEDFVDRMVKHYMEELEKEHKKDMAGNSRAIRRLRSACERAKRILSFATETRIDLDVLFNGVDFSETITRSEFEELNSDLFSKCIETVKNCLKDGQLRKDEIDNVILVGGSSRIPKIQQLLRGLLDGKELSRSIHQDEAVAYGAAVQAAFLSGHGNEKVRKLALTEVTPLCLGVGVEGGVMSVLIPRNTIIPTRKVRNYETSRDNQTKAGIQVYEGERAQSRKNKFLGEFTLTDISMAARGVGIEIRFDLQENGILNVSAKDLISGQESSICITSGRLSREEIEKMIEKAKKYKVEDERLRKKYRAMCSLTDYARRVRDEVKKKKEKIKLDAKTIEAVFHWSDSKAVLAEVSEYEEKAKLLRSILEQ